VETAESATEKAKDTADKTKEKVSEGVESAKHEELWMQNTSWMERWRKTNEAVLECS